MFKILIFLIITKFEIYTKQKGFNNKIFAKLKGFVLYLASLLLLYKVGFFAKNRNKQKINQIGEMLWKKTAKIKRK